MADVSESTRFVPVNTHGKTEFIDQDFIKLEKEEQEEITDYSTLYSLLVKYPHLQNQQQQQLLKKHDVFETLSKPQKEILKEIFQKLDYMKLNIKEVFPTPVIAGLDLDFIKGILSYNNKFSIYKNLDLYYSSPLKLQEKYVRCCMDDFEFYVILNYPIAKVIRLKKFESIFGDNFTDITDYTLATMNNNKDKEFDNNELVDNAISCLKAPFHDTPLQNNKYFNGTNKITNFQQAYELLGEMYRILFGKSVVKAVVSRESKKDKMYYCDVDLVRKYKILIDYTQSRN